MRCSAFFVAIVLLAIVQTIVAISVRGDVERCVATGRGEGRCIKIVGG